MWGRDWCCFFVEKIQALKAEKIVWLEEDFGDDVYSVRNNSGWNALLDSGATASDVVSGFAVLLS